MTWSAPIANWNANTLPRAEDGHPGAFGVERRHHFHEGVDLYTEQGGPVFAVEAGVVVALTPFTGQALGHTWWNDTDALFVHGERAALSSTASCTQRTCAWGIPFGPGS